MYITVPIAYALHRSTAALEHTAVFGALNAMDCGENGVPPLAMAVCALGLSLFATPF
jgi:hypothetical protein